MNRHLSFTFDSVYYLAVNKKLYVFPLDYYFCHQLYTIFISIITSVPLSLSILIIIILIIIVIDIIISFILTLINIFTIHRFIVSSFASRPSSQSSLLLSASAFSTAQSPAETTTSGYNISNTQHPSSPFIFILVSSSRSRDEST